MMKMTCCEEMQSEYEREVLFYEKRDFGRRPAVWIYRQGQAPWVRPEWWPAWLSLDQCLVLERCPYCGAELPSDTLTQEEDEELRRLRDRINQIEDVRRQRGA